MFCQCGALAEIVAVEDRADVNETLELDAAGCSDQSGVTMHVNKVHHVTRVAAPQPVLIFAEILVSNEMEIEDGVGEHGVRAFTDIGVENLIELIKVYRENPGLLRR